MHQDELYHYGVKGMKWGIRRYQNKDGSLTAAGSKRAAMRSEGRMEDSASYKYQNPGESGWTGAKRAVKANLQARSAARNTPEAKAARKARIKKVAIAGAAVAGTALAVYGGYKLSKALKTRRLTTNIKELPGMDMNTIHLTESGVRPGYYRKSNRVRDAVSNAAGKTGRAAASTARRAGSAASSAAKKAGSAAASTAGKAARGARQMYYDGYGRAAATQAYVNQQATKAAGRAGRAAGRAVNNAAQNAYRVAGQAGRVVGTAASYARRRRRK